MDTYMDTYLGTRGSGGKKHQSKREARGLEHLVVIRFPTGIERNRSLKLLLHTLACLSAQKRQKCLQNNWLVFCSVCGLLPYLQFAV